MTRADEIAEQTRLRRALLAGGYTPLANRDKRCFLPGWPDIEVDETVIDEWAQALALRATGVRIERGLVMIDFDIDDAETVEEIVETMPDDLWATLGECPVRLGKGAKEAWFARTADGETFGRWASAGFVRPGESEDADVHRLEVFGGASARQAGVYGAHTIGRNGKVDVAYRWRDGRGLAEVPFEGLPVVDEAQIEALCRHVNAVLTGRGWHQHSRMGGGKTTAVEVHDLTDDMIFDTVDGEMTLTELEAATLDGPVRLSASWLEGPAARNKTRCIAFRAGSDGPLQILETAAHQLHMRARTLRGRAAERLAALQAAGGGKLFGADDGAEGDGGDVLDDLLARFAFCPAWARPVVPLDGSAPMTFANFKVLTAPMTIVRKGRRGSKSAVNPADLWAADPRRLTIDGATFRPDLPAGVVEDEDNGGERRLNTYRPRHHDAPDARAEEALALWAEFMAHLVPDAVERAWLEMKIAAKAQQPGLPGAMTLLVTPAQGTGRNTLFSVLEGLFGAWNCTPVERAKLFGEGSQGQFNDWRAGHVIAYVSELLAGEAGAGFTSRRQAMYEHLKVIAEPAPVRFEVVGKYAERRMARACAALFVATNNRNALPIPPEDRRVAVLTCSGVPLADAPQGLLYRIHEAKGASWFLSAVWARLRALPVDWDAVMLPPKFAGRAAMIEANRSELDDVLDDVLSTVPGNYIPFGVLRERVRRKLAAEGILDETKRWAGRLLDTLSAPGNPSGWVYSATRRHKVARPDGSIIHLRAVARGGDFAALDAATPTARAGLLGLTGSTLSDAMAARGLRVVRGDEKEETGGAGE